MRKLLQVISLSSLLVLFGCATPGLMSNQEGMRLLNKGQAKEAETKFKKAIEENKSNAMFHNNLGYTFFLQGNIDDAEVEFKKAIELEDTNGLFHLNMGRVYKIRGKLEMALDEFTKALKLSPDLRGLHGEYIQISYDLNLVQKAISDLEAIIKETKPEGHQNINIVFLSLQSIIGAYIAQGQYTKAINMITESIELLDGTKKTTGGYVVPIILPFFIGIHRVPEKTLNVIPIRASLIGYRGLSYFQMGQYEKAYEDLHKSIDLYPNHRYGNHNLGRVFCERDDSKEAKYYFRKVIESYPYDCTAHLYYSAMLKMGGEDSRAEMEFKSAMEKSKKIINPNLKSSYAYLEALAFAYQAWGKYDEALSTYGRVTQFNPNSGWAYRKMAEIYIAKKEKDKAINALKKARYLMPEESKTAKMLNELNLLEHDKVNVL